MLLDLDNMTLDQSNVLAKIIQVQVANTQLSTTNTVHDAMNGTNSIAAMYFNTMNSDYSPAVVIVSIVVLIAIGWVVTGFFEMIKKMFS